jgi:DNA-binding CsgD family transcriptional regulator
MENTGKEDDGTLRSLVHDLQSQYSEGFWEDFNVRFREVHSEFYNRLSNDFPGLTPNEIRLCAFIKLNLTTKEIAQISHKTEHSIKIARYRLRQKLGLVRDENLTVFINRY